MTKHTNKEPIGYNMLVWTRVTLFDKGFFWYKQDCLLLQRKIATLGIISAKESEERVY